MLQITPFIQIASSDLSILISCLAVFTVAIGYASDTITQDNGFGPGGNGIILVIGAMIGILSLYFYFQFFQSIFTFNAFREHMFSQHFLKTAAAAFSGALAVFLLLIVVKRKITN